MIKEIVVKHDFQSWHGCISLHPYPLSSLSFCIFTHPDVVICHRRILLWSGTYWWPRDTQHWMGAIVTMGAVTDTENQEADNRDIVTLDRKPLQPPSWSWGLIIETNVTEKCDLLNLQTLKQDSVFYSLELRNRELRKRPEKWYTTYCQGPKNTFDQIWELHF